MRDYEAEKAELTAAIARFPAVFGLRAFHGETFRIGVRESFVDDNGDPKLYTQRSTPDGWKDFAKGTEAELAKELAPVPESFLRRQA